MIRGGKRIDRQTDSPASCPHANCIIGRARISAEESSWFMRIVLPQSSGPIIFRECLPNNIKHSERKVRPKTLDWLRSSSSTYMRTVSHRKCTNPRTCANMVFAIGVESRLEQGHTLGGQDANPGRSWIVWSSFHLHLLEAFRTCTSVARRIRTIKDSSKARFVPQITFCPNLASSERVLFEGSGSTQTREGD